MIDGIDESRANVCMVVGHKHNIKQLLTVRVKLPQLSVYSLQSLGTQPNTDWSYIYIQYIHSPATLLGTPC